MDRDLKDAGGLSVPACVELAPAGADGRIVREAFVNAVKARVAA